MIEELTGGAKKDESMLGLVRARKVLRRRWGSAHVSFGEPISLAEAIGERRARFAAEASEEDAAQATEPSMKTPIATRKIRLAPKRSAVQPLIGMKIATETR